MSGTCKECKTLLNEALNLCVRARNLDAIDRTNAQKEACSDPEWWAENESKRVANHNELFPDTPMAPKATTIHLWVEDQYNSDLAEWENKARKHLTKGCK